MEVAAAVAVVVIVVIVVVYGRKNEPLPASRAQANIGAHSKKVKLDQAHPDSLQSSVE